MRVLKTKRLGLVPSSVISPGADQSRNYFVSHPNGNEPFDAPLQPPEEYYPVKWDIFCRSDDTCVGRIYTKTIFNTATITYEIDQPYQNQGYATEATQAVSNWLLSQQYVRFVTAVPADYNPASVKILEKTGFSRIGICSKGPCWAKERPYLNRLAVCMVVGIIVGSLISLLTHNTLLGIGWGPLLALPVGGIWQLREWSYRQALKQSLLDHKEVKIYNPAAPNSEQK